MGLMQHITNNFGRSGYSLSDLRGIQSVIGELQANGYVQTFIKNIARFCKEAGFSVQEQNGFYIIKER